MANWQSEVRDKVSSLLGEAEIKGVSCVDVSTNIKLEYANVFVLRHHLWDCQATIDIYRCRSGECTSNLLELGQMQAKGSDARSEDKAVGQRKASTEKYAFKRSSQCINYFYICLRLPSTHARTRCM